MRRVSTTKRCTKAQPDTREPPRNPTVFERKRTFSLAARLPGNSVCPEVPEDIRRINTLRVSRPPASGNRLSADGLATPPSTKSEGRNLPTDARADVGSDSSTLRTTPSQITVSGSRPRNDRQRDTLRPGEAFRRWMKASLGKKTCRD